MTSFSLSLSHVAQSIRCLIYAPTDWRIVAPFVVESHPGICEADKGGYFFGDKNGRSMALTSTLSLKFRRIEAATSAPYTSFRTCRLIN